jgi:flagellar motor switch protein FliM
MAEVLSQSEIDALLSALTTGEVSAEELKQENQQKKVRSYDFRRPNKFSKDQVHSIQVIFENYGRALTTFFAGHLRAVINISVLSIEQITYDEFIRSLPNPSIINIFQMSPLEGNAILEINPNIIFTMLDRLFGGPGRGPAKIRDLTDIERTVVEKTTQRMLDLMTEPWESIMHLQPKLEIIEMNPQFTHIVAPSEMVVLISLEAEVGESQGLINCCIPYIVLEPVVAKLSAQYWFANTAREQTAEGLNALRRRVEKTPVSVVAVLGGSTITVRELLDLQRGDVIAIDRRVTEALQVYVGNKLKFLGHPGLSRNKVAIKVTGTVSEGDDIDDE